MYRLSFRVGVALSAVLVLAGPVLAHEHPKRLEGALGHHRQAARASGPASRQVLNNFQILGRTNLGGGVPNADVFFYNHGGSVSKRVYVGTWSAQCTGQGVKIIDVNDPTKPKWTGYVGARADSSNEDMEVIRVGSRDVLGIGVQACGRQGSNGLALYDVTNPARPRPLAFLATNSGVHELDLVARSDGRALALLATPFSEFAEEPSGEFQIADIGNPTAPTIVGDWSIYNDSSLRIPAGNDEITSPFQGLGLFPVMFAHSARSADGGHTAYVSYWDAGVIKLDISDPSNPATAGRTLFPVTADGDAHSMTPYNVNGQRYILQNDEDFDPGPTTARVTSSATGTRRYAGIQEPWAATSLMATGTVSGTVHDAADGCEASDYSGTAGKIALADSVDPFYAEPPCPIGLQAALAAEAGAKAFVSNLLSVDDAWGYGPDVDPGALAAAEGMPIVQISDIDELAAAIRAASGAVTMTLRPNAPSWGYLRVFREVNSSGVDTYRQVGAFRGSQINAYDTFPPPPGSWSIHNTEVRGARAYSAWYSAGLVALDMADPTHPIMVGQFVPGTSNRHANSLGSGPAEVWGLAIDPSSGVIYLSEMRTGLWIVRPTGAAAP